MINQLIKIFNEILYLGATSSILIVLIVLIKRVFGKVLNAKWHYYVWFLLLVRLIIPITPESSLSALNLFYITAEQFHLPVNEISALTLEHTGNVNTANTTLTNPPTIHGNTGNSDSTDTNTTSTINVSNYNSQSNHIPPIRILFYIWLSGIVLLTSYTIYINIAFAINIRRNYRRLHNPRINGILNECRRIVGIKRDISLFTTDRNRTPSLYTAFHTIILVSEEHLELLNDQEIKCIFLHELSHYKRKDIIVNWVVTLLQIIYFFNPLIWFAFYKVHEDCEISCDAAALKYLHEEQYQGYGYTVIRLIKLFSESNFIPSTAGLWNHKSNYKRRIIMISK